MYHRLAPSIVLFAACAGAHQAEVEQIDDPCVALETPPPELKLRQQDIDRLRYKCQVQVDVEQHQQRMEQERREAEAAAAAQKRTEEAQAALAAEAAAEAEAQIERDARAVELWSYSRALEYGTTKNCGDTWAEDLAHYEFLRDYESTPERDRAIDGMETCRKAWMANSRKVAPLVIQEFRREFAIAVEDAFDESNPYSKGQLVAKVEGSTLMVRMKGAFEGRARHSQSEVESWCAAGNVFSKITLKNMHGTFSCKPPGWIGGPRAWADRALQAEGASEPLSKAPGTKPTPVPLTEEPSGTPSPFD